MKTLQVGITGGIGSGKSLVARIFRCLGVPAYDADSRAKGLMTTDGILIRQISEEFGNLSYDSEGGLNTEYLSQRVFNDPKKLAKLNALVHPRVASDYQAWALEHKGKPYVLKEAALLFEAGSAQHLDKIIVVTAPEPMRMDRVRKRDPHRTEDDIKRIMASQMDEETKKSRADFIIVNDESQLIIPQVLDLHKRLVSQN
ncbi:MAG: dephospho-CoA kinase [Cyclobacteriaceae bacterium]